MMNDDAADVFVFEQALFAALYRAACPPPQTLADYVMTLTAPEHAARVARHLRECLYCPDEMAELTPAYISDDV